jgi:ADP-ribose pyrophosphatase
MRDDEYWLSRYRKLAGIHPEWFVNDRGCPTRILHNAAEIASCREAVRAERIAAGWQTEDLRVGLLAEDEYLGYLVRDAVKFSDGRYGLYNRIIASGGIVVLPILGQSIALIHIFRHSARRWFLEAPQGHLPAGANALDEAQRELLEEMGASATQITPLGVLYTSTGLTSEHLKMFAAKITAIGEPQRSEGIDSIKVIANSEIDQRVIDGTICDGPTISLIAHARARGLL